MLNLKDAKDKLGVLVKEKKLILFVGSGISIDRKLPIKEQLPDWEGFLSEFIKFCKNIPNQYQGDNIENILQQKLFEDAELEKKRTPAKVATVLKNKLKELPTNILTNVDHDYKKWFYELFIMAKPNVRHDYITNTNYPYILTSNYDLLLEDAQKKIGSPFASYSYEQKEKIAEALYLKIPAIIHVHGQYTDVLLDKIILTSEDYINIIKKGRPGFSFSLQALFLMYSTLFVGYGASDPHLEDLVEELAYFFDFKDQNLMSKNYLVVHRDKANQILDNYKRRMRTEIIIINDYSEYDELLLHLQNCSPRLFPL